MFDYTFGDYLITTDPDLLDVDAVHAFLSQAYWAVGRPREIVQRSLENSLCFGVYKDGEQVGLARVITDYCTYAYLCDVYILEAHRGQGLGERLVEIVLNAPELRDVRLWTLNTRDAHSLYARFGFAAPDAPERRMELRRKPPWMA